MISVSFSSSSSPSQSVLEHEERGSITRTRTRMRTKSWGAMSPPQQLRVLFQDKKRAGQHQNQDGQCDQSGHHFQDARMLKSPRCPLLFSFHKHGELFIERHYGLDVIL